MKLLSVLLYVRLLAIAGVFGLAVVNPVRAETRGQGGKAADLLAQGNLTRVTGVEVNQTTDGLELILKTAAGSERLVPLILPEGNDLVIDILDATLGFSIRNGVTETNPAPGIDRITVNKNDENSVRVRIAGANQTPNAEVLPGRDNLVLSVTRTDTTAEEPDEEIEIIATGEAEEGSDYFVTEAGVTRTNTPIIDTPGSVQVVPRQVLEDQGVNQLRDALSRNAVGVTTNGAPRSNFQDVFIRGFEVDRRTLRNGIPDNIFALSPPRGLSNIEQLEVLSGAASIINGQVSPGGIINFATKQPTDEPFYNLSLGYDSLDSIDAALDFSGPLNESKTVAYRLNASYYHSETFIDVDDVDFDRFLIAPVVSWQIGDRTKLTFEGQYLDSRAVQVPFLPASGTIFDNPNGEIPPDQFLGEPDFDGNTRQIARIGYDLEHDLSDKWSLRHAFRYAHLQNDQIGANPLALQDDLRTLERGIFDGTNDIDNYQATAYVTGEFETGIVNHQLSAGIDYVFEEDILDFEELTVGNIDIFEPEFTGELGEEVVETIDTRDTVDGLGLYVQDQLKIFEDRLILVLGGRVDFVGSTSKDLVDLSAEEESQDDSAFSPRVALLYKLADNLSVFGSFSRSFEQETGTTAEAETFEPTRGTQFEIGAKANWLNDRLSTTLALYDLTQTNVTTEDPANPQFDIQTGEQKSQGIELQTKGEILPGWNIIANYAYTDTEVTEDNTIEVGNSFADVPENAASLWNTYTISQGSLSGLGFGFGLFYVGEREGDSNNSFQIDDYLRTDAAIYYRRNDLNLALNFQNIFDENFIEEVSNDLRVVYGDPFTARFTASYQF